MYANVLAAAAAAADLCAADAPSAITSQDPDAFRDTVANALEALDD
jgi:hypothetical protein